MSWQNAHQYAKDRNEGDFVKLKGDGDHVDFVPLTDPQIRWVLWSNGTPEDVEPGTPEAKYSYVFQVLDVRQRRVRILDLGPRSFEEVAGEVAEHGEEHVYRLRRKGVAKNTSWICSHQRALDPAQVAYCRKVARLEVQGKLYPLTQPSDPGAPGETIGHNPAAGYGDYHEAPDEDQLF